jgi:hypothetical protein
MLYRIHPDWAGFELTTLVVIGTDCIGSYKSNYHTITTTTAPRSFNDASVSRRHDITEMLLKAGLNTLISLDLSPKKKKKRKQIQQTSNLILMHC